ncbi:pantoate--beta-alanine ligase [Bacillaceae bacterium S4-13-58]
MIQIKNPNELQQYMKEKKKQGKTIGFVPTMGFLHEGHQSLLKRARLENDLVVLSIFVNPLQFGPEEDFDRYPRDEEGDLQISQKEQVDIVYTPNIDDMYPRPLSISMTVNKRTNVLCGKSRPGHFDGVVTVLAKLFHLVIPDKVYFGMKDAQQVAVVKALLDDYNFPLELVGVPTVREADGLAKSSRNVYLSPLERKEAPYLYQSLLKAQETIQKGERNRNSIIQRIVDFIESNTHGKIDYVDLLTYPELEAYNFSDGNMIIAIAVHFEKARLIDNIILNSEGELVTEF